MFGAAALAWIAVLKAARKYIRPLGDPDRPLDT
jgi:hypothetical protein